MKHWFNPLTHPPVPGTTVTCILRHADADHIEQHDLKYAPEDDVAWRTLDGAELDYSVSVLGWKEQETPEVTGHAPRGWWVGEMRAIFNAAQGDTITLDMKRAANIVLKIVNGEKFDSNRAEWIPAEMNVHHPDDEAVRRFAAAMARKMHDSRQKGRHGWDDPDLCPTERLQDMLLDHVLKGDPTDVANFCMMLWTRKAPVKGWSVSPGMGLSYTCIGKGGDYALVGTAKAAGELKDVLTPQHYKVYRDTASQDMYVRLADCFDKRMQEKK